MSTERLAMRRERTAIRANSAGMPSPKMARRVGMAPSTVRLPIRRVEAASLAWPLQDCRDGRGWQPGCSRRPRQGHRRHSGPDRASVHRRIWRYITRHGRPACCDASAPVLVATGLGPAARSALLRSDLLQQATLQIEHDASRPRAAGPRRLAFGPIDCGSELCRHRVLRRERLLRAQPR